MYVLLTCASKNAHAVLTLTAVLIRTCERHKSYTFQNENAEESQEGCSGTVGIETSYTHEYHSTHTSSTLHARVPRVVFLHSIHTYMVWLGIFNHHCTVPSVWEFRLFPPQPSMQIHTLLGLTHTQCGTHTLVQCIPKSCTLGTRTLCSHRQLSTAVQPCSM